VAVARSARVDAVTPVGENGRMFRLAMVGDEPLGFVGGQYVIVDTGVTLPNGKRAKRAYSVVSGDAEQRHFDIAVKKLPGPGSCAMHDMDVGATMSFSGPWGKYFVEAGVGGRALVFATDTGITAAMGLARGRAFERLEARTSIVWYVCQGDDFMAEPFVRATLERAGDRLVIERALPVDHPERSIHAQSVVLRHLDTATSAFLSGDGNVVHPVRDALATAGLGEGQVRLESFFNSPQRRTP
jgi:ferredoxin-NADP reductase